jgi:hypothetical protein
MSGYFLDDLREELRAAATRRAHGARVRPLRIPRGAATVAAAGLVSAGAVFLGIRAIDDPPAPTGASIAGHFSILRRAPAAADAIPARWRRQLPTDPSMSPDFSAARSASGASVWIVPADGGVCMLEARGDATGFGCATTANAERGRLFSISSGAGFGLAGTNRRVAGLLPDGASHVTLRLRDGTSRPLSVRENVYAAVVPARPVELSWTDALGRPHTLRLFARR